LHRREHNGDRQGDADDCEDHVDDEEERLENVCGSRRGCVENKNM